MKRSNYNFIKKLSSLQCPVPQVGRKSIECSSPDDEIGLFTRALESTLRQFTGRQLALAKKRIYDVIVNLEMELYPPQATSSFTCLPGNPNSNFDLLASSSFNMASDMSWHN